LRSTDLRLVLALRGLLEGEVLHGVGLHRLAVEAIVEIEVAGGAVGLLGVGVEQALQALRVDRGVIRVRLGIELLHDGLRAGIGRQRGGEAEADKAEGEERLLHRCVPASADAPERAGWRGLQRARGPGAPPGEPLRDQA
jgi:hypothetical protein